VPTLVSRQTIFIDGKPACSKCLRRPRRWDGRRWQSYCTECHREDGAARRAGMIEVLLTPDEWAEIKTARLNAAAAAAAAGRHRR